VIRDLKKIYQSPFEIKPKKANNVENAKSVKKLNSSSSKDFKKMGKITINNNINIIINNFQF